MEFAAELASIYLLYLAAAMVPGPNLVVISGASLGGSRAHGVATALGVATGTVIFCLATLAGLSALVLALPEVATGLRLLGALYLLQLGLRALWRAARGGQCALPRDRRGGSLAAAYRTGLLVHLGNPKAVLFYASLLTLVMTPHAPLGVRLAAVVGIVGLSLAWYGAVALALSSAAARERYAQGARWIDGLLGTALVAASLRLALQRGE